mmetsp:Transcript_2928/g.7886  ORF Transcript_2928/g.7886 Transcript_2928/m.7886 type:complete len:219 (-) Transcript_2928:750-1406(-)
MHAAFSHQTRPRRSDWLPSRRAWLTTFPALLTRATLTSPRSCPPACCWCCNREIHLCSPTPLPCSCAGVSCRGQPPQAAAVPMASTAPQMTMQAASPMARWARAASQARAAAPAPETSRRSDATAAKACTSASVASHTRQPAAPAEQHTAAAPATARLRLQRQAYWCGAPRWLTQPTSRPSVLPLSSRMSVPRRGTSRWWQARLAPSSSLREGGLLIG